MLMCFCQSELWGEPGSLGAWEPGRKTFITKVLWSRRGIPEVSRSMVRSVMLVMLVFADDHEEDESSSCPDVPDSLRWDGEWGADVIADEADLNLEVLATVDHNLRVGGMDRAGGEGAGWGVSVDSRGGGEVLLVTVQAGGERPGPWWR